MKPLPLFVGRTLQWSVDPQARTHAVKNEAFLSRATFRAAPPPSTPVSGTMGENDPKALTEKYATRIDFQTIMFKLSTALLESRPEGEFTRIASIRI
jgi:hypothetical protein